MFWVFYCIVYIIEAVIAYIYFSENYSIKHKHIFSLLIALVLYLLGFGANILWNNNYIANVIVFLLINILYCKISFEISLKDALLHSSILVAIMTLSEMIIEAGASSLLGIPIDAYKYSFSSLVIFGSLSKALYLLVCKIISSVFSYKKSNISNSLKRNFALFLYPITITIMLLIFLYASASYEFSAKINSAFALSSIISLFFCCFIFIYNQKIQRQESELISLQSERQKDEINKTFYDLLEQKNEEQKVMVHDIKHHFSAINSMDNTEDIKSYLSEIRSEFDEYQFIGKSKNNMLDLILDKYSHICITNNIDFTADVRSSNLSFINDNDLTSLLSNLLDNAVEAATGVRNASIRFATKKEKSFDIISVINSSSHSPKARGGKLISTKTDSAFHGYGTKSIEKTAKKYNGNCLWEYEENDKTFHYTIIFNKQ